MFNRKFWEKRKKECLNREHQDYCDFELDKCNYDKIISKNNETNY